MELEVPGFEGIEDRSRGPEVNLNGEEPIDDLDIEEREEPAGNDVPPDLAVVDKEIDVVEPVRRDPVVHQRTLVGERVVDELRVR